jgi:hypothetical protein
MENNFLAIFIRDFCTASSIENDCLVYMIKKDLLGITTLDVNYYIVVSEFLTIKELRKLRNKTIAKVEFSGRGRQTFFESLQELKGKEMS